MILQIYNTNESWTSAVLGIILPLLPGQGELHLCLSGGSTPKPIYEALASDAAFKAATNSRAVHLWMGDEREAPEGSGHRNSEMIAHTFEAAGFKNFAFREPQNSENATPVATATANGANERDTGRAGLFLHAWPGGPRDAAAPVYAEEIATFANPKLRAGLPFFDLVILGMGEDGHTAGLFRAEDFGRDRDSLVILTQAPQEPVSRMTMTPQLLSASNKTLVMMRGLPKLRLLMANLFGERSDPIRHFVNDRCEVVAQI